MVAVCHRQGVQQVPVCLYQQKFGIRKRRALLPPKFIWHFVLSSTYLPAHIQLGREIVMNEEITRSAVTLVNRILNSDELTARVKDNPKSELPIIADQVIRDLPKVLETDYWVYRIVVISLGTAVLIVVAGAVTLAAINPTADVKIPEVLTAIGSAAVGALAGLLAPSPGKK